MLSFNLQSQLNKNIPPLKIIDKDSGVLLYESQPKQTVFHNIIETRDVNGIRKILYGGSARSGKSEALRWEGHNQCLRHEAIRGLLLRSTYPELEETHISKLAFDLPPQYATYNDNKHRLVYSNGSVLKFGYGQRISDFQQYLSTEWDFIMVDELVTMPFKLVLLMQMRLTASHAGYIPFMAAGTNPGANENAQMVKSYFIEKDFGAEYPDLCSKDKPYNPDEISFIQAYVHDNYKLIEKDPEIVSRLQNLPDEEKKLYYEGSWEISVGQFFSKFSRDIHVIEPFEVPKHWRCVAGMDYGNITCVEVVYQDPATKYFYVAYEWDEENEEVENKAKSYLRFLFTAGLLDVVTVADITMFGKLKEYGQKIMASNEYFKQLGVIVKPVSKKSKDEKKFRVFCAGHIRSLLNWQKDKNGFFIKKPKIYIFNRCKKLIKTFPKLIASETDAMDWDMYKNDPHYVDALKFALISIDEPDTYRMNEDDKLRYRNALAESMRRSLV